jgi:hypothetical protein
MTARQGRPRRYALAAANDSAGIELSYLLGLLDELVVRTEDQVEHLPAEAFNYLGPNSTLSIGRLILHLVGADLSMWAAAARGAPQAPYADRLVNVLPGDFSSPPGDLSFAPEILRDHMVWRRTHLIEPCRVPGFLDRTPDHPVCRTNRELLAHMVWHWSYHSGQIGLIALEAGYDYVWTSTPKT